MKSIEETMDHLVDKDIKSEKVGHRWHFHPYVSSK
jgi:hypothetical protein